MMIDDMPTIAKKTIIHCNTINYEYLFRYINEKAPGSENRNRALNYLFDLCSLSF